MERMDKVQKAIVYLLQGDGVFYASLLMQMVHVSGKDLPEHALAGVAVRNGRIYLYVDPPRLEKFNVKQVAHIMEHECLHLVLEHISRRGTRHPLMWNIATDLAVNSLITDMSLGLIPGKGEFADMPREKTADFYYALLQNKIQGYTVTFNKDGTITIKNDRTGKETTLKPTGDHKGWQEGSGKEGSDATTREVIKQAIEQAYAQAKAQGNVPGGLEDLLKDWLGKEKVNWRKLLKQYVGNRVRADSKYSWKRPSKRYGIDQKGKIRTRMLDICLAIDTSGSVGQEEFNEFMAEIYGLMRSYKTTVTVIECDAEVQKVYKLRKHQKIDTAFKGRGGTAFEPVFEYLDERKIRPGILIYFTDLCGSFPPSSRIRTVWVQCSTAADWGNQKDVPFGRLIRIPKNEQ